jgi:hypothetical protein
MSRSFARKNVERAATRFDRRRMPPKASSAIDSILPASRLPISSTPRKYDSTR